MSARGARSEILKMETLPSIHSDQRSCPRYIPDVVAYTQTLGAHATLACALSGPRWRRHGALQLRERPDVVVLPEPDQERGRVSGEEERAAIEGQG